MLLLPVPPAGAEPVVLKANLQGSISHPFYGWSLTRLKEEVERQSDGSLVIEIGLFRDDQVIGAVTSGAVKIGFTSSTMFADRVPAVAIIGQPFLFNFPALVGAATSPGSEIRTLIDDGILRQMGLRVLWWQSNSVNAFFSKGWDAADVGLLQGKRVAVPTKTAGGLIAHCGGIPIALSAEGHEAGIRDGAVDMAMLAFPGVQSQGLWKVTDAITFTAHAGSFRGGQADDSQVIAIDQMLHLVPRAEPGQQPLVERRRDLGPKCSAPAVEPGDPRSTWAIRSRSSFISLVRRGRAADRCANHPRIGSVRRLLHTR